MGKPFLPDGYDEFGDRGRAWVSPRPKKKTPEELAQITVERVKAEFYVDQAMKEFELQDVHERWLEKLERRAPVHHIGPERQLAPAPQPRALLTEHIPA